MADQEAIDACVLCGQSKEPTYRDPVVGWRCCHYQTCEERRELEVRKAKKTIRSWDLPDAQQLFRPDRVIIPPQYMTPKMAEAKTLEEMADALVDAVEVEKKESEKG